MKAQKLSSTAKLAQVATDTPVPPNGLPSNQQGFAWVTNVLVMC